MPITPIGATESPLTWPDKVQGVVDFWSGPVDLESFEVARVALNAAAADLSLPALDDGDLAGVQRAKINAIISALDIPAGADLYHDYRAGRYFGPTVTDTHATNILLPNSEGIYETFGPDVLVRNEMGLFVTPTRTQRIWELICDTSITGWATTGNITAEVLTLNARGLYKGVRVASTGTNVFGRIASRANVSVTSGVTYSCQFEYIPGTSGSVRMQLNISGGGNCAFNGPPGSLALFGPQSIGAITNISDVLTADGVTRRVTFNYVPNANYTNLDIGIGPDTTTVGGNVIVLGAQIEEGLFSTYPIVSNGSTVQRDGNTPRIDVTGKLGNVGGCFTMLMENFTLLQGSTRLLTLSNGLNEGQTALNTAASGALRVAGRNGEVNFGANAPWPNSQTLLMAMTMGVQPDGHLHGYFVTANGAVEVDTSGGITPDGFTMLSPLGTGFSNSLNHYGRVLKLAGFYDFARYDDARALADAMYAEEVV